MKMRHKKSRQPYPLVTIRLNCDSALTEFLESLTDEERTSMVTRALRLAVRKFKK